MPLWFPIVEFVAQNNEFIGFLGKFSKYDIKFRQQSCKIHIQLMDLIFSFGIYTSILLLFNIHFFAVAHITHTDIKHTDELTWQPEHTHAFLACENTIIYDA